MSYGVLIAPPEAQNMAGLARASEDAGFEMLAFGDSQSIYRELYVSMAVAAQATSKIKLITGVSNLVTRHIAVTASAIMTLDELAPGRVILGLGSGDSSVYNLQEKPVGLSDIETAIGAIRTMFRGETVSYRERDIHVKWANRQVPIYMAAEGPKTLQLAGAVADGVIVGCGLFPGLINDAILHLETGARRVGRSLKDIDIWFFIKSNLGPTDKEAVAEIQMALAASANHAFRFNASGKDLPDELQAPIARLQREYAFHQHEQNGPNKNAQLVEELGLSQYLADRFAVVGTPETVVKRLKVLHSYGIRNMLLTALVPKPMDFMKMWQEGVAPQL